MTDLSSDIDRVLAIGRERGSLTVAELNRLLPVERMAPEEIARLIVRLEDAGIPVELDDDELTRPAPGQPSVEVPPAIDLAPPPPEPVAAPPRPVAAGPLAGTGGAASRRPRLPGWPLLFMVLVIAIVIGIAVLR